MTFYFFINIMYKIFFITSSFSKIGSGRYYIPSIMERYSDNYDNEKSNPSWVLTTLAEHLYRVKNLSLNFTKPISNFETQELATGMHLNESEFMDSARLWFSTVQSSNEKINYCKSLCTSDDIYECSYTAECLLIYAKETKHTWKIRHANIDSRLYISDYNDSFEIKTKNDIINILKQNKLIYSSFCFNESIITENLGSYIRNDYSYVSNTTECKYSSGAYLISVLGYETSGTGVVLGGYGTYTTSKSNLNNYREFYISNETGDDYLVNNFGVFNFNAIVEIGEKEDEKENCDNTNNASIDNSNNSTSAKSSKKEKTYLGLMITFLIMFVASVPLSIIFTIKYAQMKSLGTSNSADRGGISVGV